MNTYVGRQMPENGIENGIYFDEENNKIKIFSNNEVSFTNNVINNDSIFGTWKCKLFDDPIYKDGNFDNIEVSYITFIKSSVFTNIGGYIINFMSNDNTELNATYNFYYFSLSYDNYNRINLSINGKYILIDFLTIENDKLILSINGKFKAFEKIEIEGTNEEILGYINELNINYFNLKNNIYEISNAYNIHEQVLTEDFIYLMDQNNYSLSTTYILFKDDFANEEYGNMVWRFDFKNNNDENDIQKIIVNATYNVNSNENMLNGKELDIFANKTENYYYNVNQTQIMNSIICFNGFNISDNIEFIFENNDQTSVYTFNKTVLNSIYS